MRTDSYPVENDVRSSKNDLASPWHRTVSYVHTEGWELDIKQWKQCSKRDLPDLTSVVENDKCLHRKLLPYWFNADQSSSLMNQAATCGAPITLRRHGSILINQFLLHWILHASITWQWCVLYQTACPSCTSESTDPPTRTLLQTSWNTLKVRYNANTWQWSPFSSWITYGVIRQLFLQSIMMLSGSSSYPHTVSYLKYFSLLQNAL